jgi:hypothetical protein
MTFEATLRRRLTGLEIRQSPADAEYQGTYRAISRFFRERIVIRDLRESDAAAAVILVYSWMGRARLKADCLKNFPVAKEMLRNKRGDFDTSEVEELMSYVGGSLVATSKFLHFAFPDEYGIWDQNVAFAGYWKSGHLKSIEDYRTYVSDLRKLALPETIEHKVRAAIGMATAVRTKEFALFHLGIAQRLKYPTSS